jgi:undecaprenyl-diphosphatase
VTKRAKRPIAGCVACAICLAMLVVLAYYAAPIGRLDAEVLDELAASPGSFPNFAVSLFERFADWLPQVAMVAVACLIALRAGRPRHAIAVVALVAGTALVTQALKVGLSHPRYQPILGDHQISSTGFPSGHSAGVLAIVLAFAFVAPRSRRVFIAVVGIGLVLAVSASLIMLNLHYPSNVLGGWLVAAGLSFALIAAGIDLEASHPPPEAVVE